MQGITFDHEWRELFVVCLGIDEYSRVQYVQFVL